MKNCAEFIAALKQRFRKLEWPLLSYKENVISLMLVFCMNDQ